MQPNILAPLIESRIEEELARPDVLLRNCLVEPGPEGGGVPYTVHPMPSVEQVASVGGVAAAGVFQEDGILGGKYYIFADQGLYEQTTIGAAPVQVDNSLLTVSNLGYIQSAGIRNGFICYTSGYPGALFSWDGATAATVGLNSIDVTSYGRRFFSIDLGTDQIQYSDLGTANFPAINFFTAEQRSDENRAIHANTEVLYIAGTKSTEIWRTSPDNDLPVSYTGVSLPFGASGPGGMSSSGENMVVVGGAENGFGVWSVRGANYQKISPNWLDRRLERIAARGKSREIHTQCYTLEGHAIAEIYLPAQTAPTAASSGVPQGGFEGLILTFDFTTGAWAEVYQPDNVKVQTWLPDRRFHFTAPLGGGGTTFIGQGFVHQNDTKIGVVTRHVSDNVPGRYLSGLMDYRISYWEPAIRTNTQVEATLPVQFVQPAQSTDPLVDARGTLPDAATIAAAIAGNPAYFMQYWVSDNLGMDYRGPRDVTVNYSARTGHYVKTRRGGEVRQPGRIHQFRFALPYNFSIGPLMVNTEPLIGT